MSRTALYERLDSDPAFRKAFDDGVEQGTDVIEQSATRRAVDGVEEPVIYRGQLQYRWVDAQDNPCEPESPGAKRIPLTVRKPSDVLAIFLLKGRRPAKFRDNVDITSGGKALTVKVLRGVEMDEL